MTDAAMAQIRANHEPQVTPERSSGMGPIRLIPVVIVAVLSFVVFLITLSPEVGPGDSAELALQAHQLGVTHPPGYPVHTFLGKLLGLFLSEPALATNLLSAICTSLAVGLLCAVTLALTGDRLAAILAALVFAFVPAVWGLAVKTEVYNVNILFVALAVLLALSYSRRATPMKLVATCLVLGVSLGTSLANILLLPGLAVAIVRPKGRRWARVGISFLIIFAVGSLSVGWSLWRSATHPPLGTTYIPDSAGNLLRFLAGSQYRPDHLDFAPFYLGRIVEHARHWADSFLWVGLVLGLVGLGYQWKTDRRVCITLLLMFLANLGYFTGHPWKDYQDMVHPSYFVFAIWIAYGIRLVGMQPWRRSAVVIKAVIPLAIVAWLIAAAMPDRLSGSRGRPVTDFALSSFEVLPEGATVIVSWNKFTPLLYLQETRGLRMDLAIVERSDEPRYYRSGPVPPWRTYLHRNVGSRPVVIDGVDDALMSIYDCRHIGLCWYELTTRSSQ